MAKKAYVFGALSPIVGEPPLPTDHFRECFSLLIWEEGQAPQFENFNDCASGRATIRIEFADNENDIRQTLEAKIKESYGVDKQNIVWFILR